MRIHIVIAKPSENETDDQPGFIRAAFCDASRAANHALKLQRTEKNIIEVQAWEVQP